MSGCIGMQSEEREVIMGQAVLVIGKSGSGKSTSLRNLSDVGVINVLGKPLPFKGDVKWVKTDDYAKVKSVLLGAQTSRIVIDDAGYLMTNQFMRGHSKGGNVFDLYNSIGDNFWDLIQFIGTLPEDKIVYIFMHEDKNDYGDIKPKTIGKMLDDKVCIEGMFTVVLRALYNDGKYQFKTRTDGLDVVKSPIGMFSDEYIDNDLKIVDDKIRSYYNIGGNKE